MYRFPWYLTLVSTNHASSNPGQIFSKRGVWVRLLIQSVRLKGAWGPFLESPGNFSGPKLNIQSKSRDP